MTLGKLLRKLLGPEYFAYAGKAYRRIFVDLEKVAHCLPEMPSGSHLLDIGGGDGELINSIKKRFPNIKISMIDISHSIGDMIDEKHKASIDFFPSTSIAQFREKRAGSASNIDFILISDVIHHVAPEARKRFFSDLSKLVSENTVVIIKDIEPGFFLSRLSYWADKYISGDRTVALTSKNELIRSMTEIFPKIHYCETGLFRINKPNFALAFSLKPLPKSPDHRSPVITPSPPQHP